MENDILNNISLIFLNRLQILSESDTIYKRSEIVGGAISDRNWKEIWKKYSGTREWPKICRVLGCSMMQQLVHTLQLIQIRGITFYQCVALAVSREKT